MAKKTTSDATAFKQSDYCELLNIVKLNSKFLICAGKYKVSTREFNSIEEAENYIASRPYELTVNLCCLFVELKNKENNETKQNENTEKMAEKEQK